MRAAVVRFVRAQECLRGTAAAFLPGRRGAQSGGGRDREEIVFAAAGDKWRFPCAAGRARTAGRVYLHSESPGAGDCGAATEPEFGAPFEVARGDGTIVCGFAGSNCEHPGALVALGIYAGAFGV